MTLLTRNEEIEEGRGPSGGHPPLTLGRQGTRAGPRVGGEGRDRLVQWGTDFTCSRGDRALWRPCLHHPGLNSAEGGIGGWESLPSPNDPGTDGRAAVPTSADASTPQRRDSGYSSAPRKARTSEYREELEYELECRGVTERKSVGDMRAMLRQFIKLEAQGKAIVTSPGTRRDPATELDVCKNKMEELNKLLDAYSREKSQERKMDTGLTHLLNRVERIAPPRFRDGPGSLSTAKRNIEVKGQTGEVDTSSSEAEEQDEGAVSRVREPAPEPTSIRTVIRQTQVPVRDWGVTFSGDGQGPSLPSFLDDVDHYRRARHVSERDLFLQACDLFRAPAAIWYRSVRREVTSWEDRLLAEIMSHLEATQRETLDGVVREFVGRVGTPLGCTHRVKHVVDTGDSKPIKQRYYPVSPVLERAMHAELDEMLQAGVVEPSKSAWSSPVVMIRKKDGSYRFCADYRKVNAVTRRDAYPLPYVSHILDRLRNARYLSSLAVKSAYWQVPLSEESKERTAFTVPCPELERTLFVYLDDIIVYSAQFDEHVGTPDRVFKKLKEAGLTLNLEKCQFCRPELRYLGYVVDRTGLRVDAQKVECIVNFSAPRTPTHVRRFLGMCGWYRRFIPEFSTVAAPLTDLMKKGRAWLWSGECERAFAQLKEHLVTAPILTCPDFERPFIIQTDASGKGIGAILSQELPDGERVVAYASRALSKAERNYSTTEQECLAVIWAVEKFRPYLEGTEFTVITDLAALKWLNGLKDPVGRLARGELFREVTESSRDGWYQGMLERVQKDPQRYPRWEVRDGDQLFRCIVGKSSDDPWRLVVPKSLRLVVLQECRDSHPAARLGVFRARQWIQGRYYWRGMWTDVERFVARTRACLPSQPLEENIEEGRGPSGGHPPLTLGRQGTRAGPRVGGEGRDRLVQWGTDFTCSRGDRALCCRCLGAEWRVGGRSATQGPCLHHPGLNSAEGGIGVWESLPSPNDPGTDGRAAVPTSADASTPRRRDSGYSSAPRKARTSEYRYTGG
ncbi:hypothetical protein AAG570_000945 [Ranatra chinensis]|uniref:RNA-directed DNA polymerase n=1 Tax=Ranatra chinensis TaxID=642074 RepID=A0ABD0Z0P2_9HEMI